ncbi:MAG: hypothetical protein HY593_03040 [Candidatus Omnitrophica bacterium]|nr:hypothetical protein [Candidatus Omnitrophota bacterium]
MDHPRKILILYASAGHGHEKAARALEEIYLESYPDREVKVVDTLALTSFSAGRNYSAVYYFLIKRAPWLWGFFYHVLDVPWVYQVVKVLRRFWNRLIAKPLEAFLIAENPSVVISTHFLSTDVVGRLKSEGRIHSSHLTVVTDYLPHWIWTEECVDAFITALPETKEGLVERGIPGEKIRVMGIPVERKFSEKLSTNQIRLDLGVPQNRFTVLLTSGGEAVGAIGRIAERLLEADLPLQALVVCGWNKKLFNHLNAWAAQGKPIKLFGFVDNMHELMQASDLVIGKGGGLTVTESLSLRRPMIIFRPLPGQEARNAACLQRYQAGFVASSVEEAVRFVREFSQAPWKLAAVQENAVRMVPRFASKEIVDWIENEFRT